MNAKEIALTAVAGIAFNGAVFLLWFAWREIRAGQRRFERIHRHTYPLDGSHEACEVPVNEQLVFERYASRYAGLGEEAAR